ncbi:multiple sugar transport system ATP-binding protein [Mesorhizobium robiniae]|uniref:Multiple sugar transport system ATP-binding protein n=1 Tax=Mesorhizobium robiniae TaxID=559315 RepID=A0ABV2GT63_9HYPH
MASHGLDIQSVSKRFGDVEVLSDISLSVRAGEFVTLLGPSGCGKSTLLRIVAGLEHPDTGSIGIDDRSIDHVAPKDRGVAFVFQNYALYPHLTAYQNIAAPLVMRELTAMQRLPFIGRRLPGAASVHVSIDERVRKTADKLQIGSLLHRRPGELSGGQRQRVAVGRALVRAPQLFLMDEPLANLDAGLRIHMRSEIARLHQEIGATTLFVTHDQAEAAALSDRVAVIFGGRIRQFAAPQELYRDPVDLEVARFLTQPFLNVLETPVPIAGRVTIGGLHVAVRDTEGAAKPGKLAFRPEHATLVAAGKPGALPVIVKRIEHSGTDAHVFVDLQAGATGLVVRIASEEASSLRPDAATALLIDSERAWFFPNGGARHLVGRARAA